MTKTTNHDQFGKLSDAEIIAKIVLSQKELLPLAREAAERAVVHACGSSNDCRLLTKLYNTLDENFIRRIALVKWAIEYAPVKFEKQTDGKQFHFVKDKTRGDITLDAEAFRVPFWEFAPAAAPKPMDINTFKADIKALMDRYAKRAQEMVNSGDHDQVEKAEELRQHLVTFSKGSRVEQPPKLVALNSAEILARIQSEMNTATRAAVSAVPA